MRVLLLCAGLLLFPCAGLFAQAVREADIPPLIQQVKTGAPDAQKKAIDRLADIADPRVVGVLSEAARNGEPVVRARVAGALGKRGGPEAVQTLAMLMKDEFVLVRAEAVKGLGLTNNAGAVPLLLPIANDPKAEHRAQAVEALGYLLGAMNDTEAAVKHLLPALRDPDWSVRMAAVRAFRSCPDPRALPALANLITDMRDAEEISSVIEGIIEARRQTITFAQMAPVRMLLQHPDNDVRVFFIRFFGRLRDRESVETLIQTLTDPKLEIRSAAAQALLQIRDTRALPALCALADDPHSHMRIFSVKALVWARDADAFARLLVLKDDTSVRSSVIDALPSFEDPRVLDVLLGMASDADADMRRRVMQKLRY